MQILTLNNRHNPNINFGMLKKSSLSNLEKVFAETFKAPLEKMNKVEDLHRWSNDYFLCESLVKSEQKGIQDIRDLWSTKISKITENLPDGSLWKTILFNNIKKFKDTYSPYFDNKIVKNTIQSINEKVSQKCGRFNFMKEYTNNLKEATLKKYFNENTERTGWLKFSHENNNGNIAETIKDIRNLSIGTKWCTKSDLYANLCLEDGDFYIYYEKGQPILGVRTRNNLTYEIKNKLNQPQYETLATKLNDLTEKYPEIKFYRDNISLLD